MEQPPPPKDVGPPRQPDLFCAECGYDLAGLDLSGDCPECGALIARSLERTLGNASDDYLGKLSFGLLIVLVVTLVSIVNQIAQIAVSIASAFAAGVGGVPLKYADLALSLLGITTIFLAGVGLYGWWLFTTRDPGLTGRHDGTTARRIVRISIIITTVITVGSALNQVFVPMNAYAGATTFNAIIVGAIVLSIFSIGAWVAQYLATMLYIRWLADRVPDVPIANQTRLYIWLLPVLYVVGFACAGIGPIISLIIYVIFLFQVRAMIERVRAAGPTPRPETA